MGPFGSCSRDEDLAVHCTTPSYSNPKFNMTYVQSNSVFYPANMASHMAGSKIRGLTIFHCVLFALYVLVSISYWFPLTTSRIFNADSHKAPAGFITLLSLVMMAAAIGEFFVNFGMHVNNVSLFNSIDNFYAPAPCGQTRQLKSGILLVAQAGKMYNMVWTAWSLIYLIAGLVIIFRIVWLKSNYDKCVSDEATRRRARDVERAAEEKKKATDTFRVEVEKEKEKIRSTALEEIKAEEAKGAKSSSDESAPPYIVAEITH